jgi:hypothetical protein
VGLPKNLGNLTIKKVYYPNFQFPPSPSKQSPWVLRIWVAKGTTSKEMVENRIYSNKPFFMVKFPKFWGIGSTQNTNSMLNGKKHTGQQWVNVTLTILKFQKHL